MKKTNLIALVSIIGLILVVIIFIKLYGLPIGFKCGYYNFALPYKEDCKCIGIKTGGCPKSAVSCDKAITKCLGVTTQCFRTYVVNHTKEIISCKD